MVNIAMNRAVHLARRDAHYRRFQIRMRDCAGLTSLARRHARIQMVLYHITEAHREAVYAMRGFRKARLERQFVRFLDLMRDAAQAAAVMVQHEGLIKEDRSFLNQFLETKTEIVGRFEEHHRKMLEESLGGIGDMVAAAEKSYRKLRRRNLEALSPDEHRRYKTAYDAAMHGGMGGGPRSREGRTGRWRSHGHPSSGSGSRGKSKDTRRASK